MAAQARITDVTRAARYSTCMSRVTPACMCVEASGTNAVLGACACYSPSLANDHKRLQNDSVVFDSVSRK